jgi:hypothetical protein
MNEELGCREEKNQEPRCQEPKKEYKKNTNKEPNKFQVINFKGSP